MRGSNEPPENPQIASVQVLSLFDSLGCFQNHRQIPEPWVIDQVPERFQAPCSRPRLRRGDQRGFRSRGSYHLNARRAADLIPTDRSSRSIVSWYSSGVASGIARRENMASIHANAEPLGMGHLVEDCSQVLKAISQARPLAGSRLEVDGDFQAVGAPVHLDRALRDPRQAGLFTRAHVRPGMDDQFRYAEQMAALYLDGQGRDRLLPERGVGAGRD